MKTKLLTICLLLFTTQVFAKFDKNKKYYDEFGYVIKYFPKCSSGKYNKLVDGNEVYFTCKHNIHGVITKEEHKKIQGKEWWKDNPLVCLANKNKNFYMNQKEKYKGKCSYRGYGLISYEKFKKILVKESRQRAIILSSDNKFENENIMAPWNNPLLKDDIMAPWNNPLFGR